MSYCSYEVFLWVEVIIVVAHSITNHIIEIHTVAKEATDTTEALDELVAIGRLVSDELDGDTIVFVVKAEPVSELLTADDLQVDTCLGVLEVLRVLLLLSIEEEGLGLVLDRVLDLISHNLDVFEEHHCLKRSELQSLHCVFHTESDHSSVESDLLKEPSDDLLLLNKLDVRERVLSQCDGLVEALVETIGDIDGGQDGSLQSEIKMITLLHNELKIGTTSNDDTTDVGSVVGDKVLSSELTTLNDVQMTLLFSETSETNGGLTTTTVLLGELDGHTLDDLLVVTLEGGEEHTITVNDNETELVVILKEGEEWLRLEAVLALVGEHINGAEWFQGDLDLSLSVTILHQNDTTEDDKTIGWDMLVQLQLLSCRGNGRNDGLACLTRLNRLSTRQFLCQ